MQVYRNQRREVNISRILLHAHDDEKCYCKETLQHLSVFSFYFRYAPFLFSIRLKFFFFFAGKWAKILHWHTQEWSKVNRQLEAMRIPPISAQFNWVAHFNSSKENEVLFYILIISGLVICCLLCKGYYSSSEETLEMSIRLFDYIFFKELYPNTDNSKHSNQNKPV